MRTTIFPTLTDKITTLLGAVMVIQAVTLTELYTGDQLPCPPHKQRLRIVLQSIRVPFYLTPLNYNRFSHSCHRNGYTHVWYSDYSKTQFSVCVLKSAVVSAMNVLTDLVSPGDSVY
ncbi:hypothetical protein BaRGS_00005628 [Batillaria attramentaria]|uniref:Uncharacterized protein n=1 Tax=Batillaria attramentaria TaxID=370345 RepID=A0ABD0LUN1_9CAEN